MASHITTLSIFIILLAFFIALNALSHFVPEKATPILESLHKTFGTQKQDIDLEPSIRQDPAKAADRGDILEDLEGLFRARIQGVEAVTFQGRDTLILRAPLDAFQNAVYGVESDDNDENLNEPETQQAEFLTSLKTMVTTGRTGKQYHMKAIANVASQDDILSPQTAPLSKRMSRIAAKIEAAGIPKPLLGIGLQEGPAGKVDLVFTPYKPYAAQSLGTTSENPAGLQETNEETSRE